MKAFLLLVTKGPKREGFELALGALSCWVVPAERLIASRIRIPEGADMSCHRGGRFIGGLEGFLLKGGNIVIF